MAITRKWGQLIKFVELRAAIENLDAVRSLERETVKNILGADYRVFHRLPKKGNRAEILRDIGILRLIESGEIYCYDTPLVKDIAEKAIARSQHIWQFFQLTVHDGLTPVEIVHKILKRLGYEIDKPNRPGAIHLAGRLGPIHNQVQYYQIVDHPEPQYKTFLNAARQRLQAVAVISRGELDSLLETTAIPHNPVLEKVSEDTLPNLPIEEGNFYSIWKGDEEERIDDDIGLKEIDY
jgi:hypothetical protein